MWVKYAVEAQAARGGQRLKQQRKWGPDKKKERTRAKDRESERDGEREVEGEWESEMERESEMGRERESEMESERERIDGLIFLWKKSINQYIE